ncbi:MAG: hypothetical protein ACO294_05230 [Methylococcales bacterium]
MRVDFYSLHWDNVNQDMLKAHKRVMEHFNIPMNYHAVNMNHGNWMQRVINNSNSDVVVILEPDCIPLNKDIFEYIKYAHRHETFVGIAQVSNHIPPKSHIYAAPAFYAMSKKAYKRLGQPGFTETHRSDTAEEICYIAEDYGVKYRALMPTYFEKPPSEGLWPLSNLGYYGIGTVFDNSIYHLYQSRMAENIEMFIKRCDEVINGTFTTEQFTPATTFTL